MNDRKCGKIKFEAFVNDIETNHWNVFGVEVYENGVLTHSCGETEEKHHAAL